MQKSGGDQDDEYKQMFLRNAKEVFQQYLRAYRKAHTGSKGPPNAALVAVDTALLGLLVDADERKQLYTLLESPNACAKDISERKLRDGGKHYALSLLYKSHKDYQATLSIWKSILTGEIKDDDYTAGLQGMVALLLAVPDTSLVAEYGNWIVEQDEQIGLKIFMPGDSKRTAMFDPKTLLERFKGTLSQNGIVAYLEYLVFQRKSDNTEHRTDLCLLYIDILASILADERKSLEYTQLVDEYRENQKRTMLNHGVTMPRVQRPSDLGTTFLSFLNHHAASDDISKYRAKLVQLLQTSSKSDAETILPKVNAIPQLQTEKAILLSCVGKPDECIKVMVKDVKDYLGVEIYCLNAGTFQDPKKGTKATSGSHVDATVAETRKTLFMILLKEYLATPPEQGGTVLSLRLLNSQSTYLELSEVIDLLPHYWTVELLRSYLLRSLRRNYHVFKEIQVVKGLSLGENLRVSEDLFKLYEEYGPVVVTQQDACSVCGASIADSVFMRTLDHKTIHLHCGSPQVTSSDTILNLK